MVSLIDCDEILEVVCKFLFGIGVSIYFDFLFEISDLCLKLLNECFVFFKDERKKLKLIYIKEFLFVLFKKVNRG